MLRTNVADWSDEKSWKAYIQLTEAEAAFRIHKSDLSLRPICIKLGLGNEPRRVLAELSDIRSMDVALPTRSGPEIRPRCISKPTDHQQILLKKTGLKLSAEIIQHKNVVETFEQKPRKLKCF